MARRSRFLRPDPAGGFIPPLPVEPTPPKVPLVFTQEEKADHLARVEALIDLGKTFPQIMAEMRKVKVGTKRTAKLLALIRAARKDDRDLETKRADAISRAHYVRRLAIAKEDRNLLLQSERFLADLEGTRAPQELVVHVHVSATVTKWISSLTPEMTQRMLDRARENRRLADQQRAIDRVIEMEPQRLPEKVG